MRSNGGTPRVHPASTEHEIVTMGEVPEEYLWHLTRAAIDGVLHYTHWIPIGRGFTEQFLAKHYSGWTLGGLVQLFDRAGLRIAPDELDGAAGAPHGGRCHWQVVSLEFDAADQWRVVRDRAVPRDEEFLGFERTTLSAPLPTGRGARLGGSVPAVARTVAVDLSGRSFPE